ncbi:glycogen synthase GlgA [Enorma phocaeensis]|uniref:glycogen synthase GlgA n=1 Tax=Enorma phocaeensis TaxID=1871019 RepID=UPI0023549902|nr:glycogen synthase GlgA [Enorma phocaeensis]
MSDKKMQVVIASAECAPFVKTGGLGDVAGSLPQALVAAGADVIVMLPKYGSIPQRFTERMEHFCDFYVSLGWRNEYCGLERLDINGVTYLFVDNEHYFMRDYPYGFFDDGERFAFFSKAVTESLQHLPEGFECDVLHCNDWHTALAPVFLREFYQGLPLYERVKTVFTIHNIAFQGQYSDTILNDILGLAHIPAAAGQLRCDSRSINFMQGALKYSDAITTVSPSYAWEIQTPEYGEGLDGILRERSSVLSGILNGIDVDDWNPETDSAIAQNYKVGDMAGKAACKRALQEELGLEVRDDRPLMVMVTRLTRQKGMDLVTYALDRILSGGVQVAVLGTGDYEEPMRYFSNKYPGTMAARITFDSALSHRMYAGADMFLMPSLFEPCGLSQIIAMRYGTLPVVRETGGLRDTVKPYNYFTGEGTGFSFANFNGDEMGDAVFRGARLFWDDRAAWDQVVKQAMEADFSWTRSAHAYLDLYHGLHPDCSFVVPAPAPAVEETSPQEVATEAEKDPNDAPKAAEPVEDDTTQAEHAADAEPAPAPKAEVTPAAEAEPAAKATVAESAASQAEPVSEPKEEPAADAKAAPAKKPAARRTTSRKTTAKQEEAAETKPAAKKTRTTTRKTTAAKTTAAKSSTTATKSAAKSTATKSTATKSTGTKPAATKAAAAKASASSTATKAAAPKSSATKAAATTKTTASKAPATEEEVKKPAPKTRTVSSARKTSRKRTS